MSDEAHQQLADQFRTMLWRTWQGHRRSPIYRRAVAQFRRGLRDDIRALTAQRQALEARGRAWMTASLSDLDNIIAHDMDLRVRLEACQRVLHTYSQVKRSLRHFRADLTPAERHTLDDSQGDKYAALNHMVMDMIAPCLAQDILDQVPALTQFATVGALRFPLPHRLPWVIEEVCRDLLPARVVRFDDTRQEVHIALKTDTSFPQQVVMDLLEIMSSAYSPQQRSRWGGESVMRRLQPIEHYRDVFLVYDLRQRHLSYTEIAAQAWPKEFKRYKDWPPHKNPTVQRVRNHLRLAEQLIHPTPC